MRLMVHRTPAYDRWVSKRLSLILGDAEREQLEPYIRAGTDQHRVLQTWAAEHGAQ